VWNLVSYLEGRTFTEIVLKLGAEKDILALGGINKFFIEISEGKKSLGISVHLCIDGRIILKLVLKKLVGRVKTRFVQLRIVTNGSPLLMW